jgi:Na+-translocating ferredoxin:NAD+ oxidoreductase RnfG subunit
MRYILKTKILSYVIILVCGVLVGRFFDNGRSIVEERTVYKDRVKTVIKEVITQSPDGTTVTERTTTKKEKKDLKKNRLESKVAKANWGIGVGYEMFRPEPVYTIDIKRRVIWDLYLGAYGRTDGRFGVGITYLF